MKPILRELAFRMLRDLEDVKLSNLTLDQRLRHERLLVLVRLLKTYVECI